MTKDYNAETLFPVRLVEETVAVLRHRGARFITYKELQVPSLFPHRMAFGNYALEYLAYKARTTRHRLFRWPLALSSLFRLRGPRAWRRFFPTWGDTPPTVILQHDADRQPYKTVDLMRQEEAWGVRSSNYFFVRRHQWDDDHEPYELDVAELCRLESAGLEVGYHLNAYELAGYDLARAWEIVAHDVAWFQARFNLRTFVPHGGVRGPGGLNNAFIPYRGPLQDLVWAYNGQGRYGFIKDISWSDGEVYVTALADPRCVAASLVPGQRALFLMHPQYYGDRLMPEWEKLPLARLGWWRDLWGLGPA